MLIDLRKIQRSGKNECDFHFEYTPETNLVELPNSEIVLPISVTGTATITDKHACYVEGEISFTLKSECTRCLEETNSKEVYSFSLGVDEDGTDGYAVVNDVIDLSKIVDDEIIMNMPKILLCSEDCKGICLGCGANLNKEKCKCEK